MERGLKHIVNYSLMKPVEVWFENDWVEITTRVYPYFMKRVTSYHIEELIMYIKDTHKDNTDTFDLDFFIENIDEVMFQQVDEFHFYALNLHEKSNSLRLQGQLNVAYRRIQVLKNRIKNLIKIKTK